MNKFLWILLWFLLMLGLCSCGKKPGQNEITSDPSAAVSTTGEAEGFREPLVITALPVYKADCFLLQYGEEAMLIDTGEPRDAGMIMEELSKRGIRKLSAILLTHFDKDHAGGASYLLKNVPVKTIYLPNYLSSKDDYYELRGVLEEMPDTLPVWISQAPKTVSFGETQMTIYPAKNGAAIMASGDSPDNNLSLVTLISFGKCRFLFTGDIEELRIKDMLKEEVDWHCDWMKIPHHGNYCSKTKDLLDAAEPQFAVICCSEALYAEPKTIKALEKREITYYDTVNGAVVTTCDGKSIRVEKVSE